MSKFTSEYWEYDTSSGCIHQGGKLIAEVAGAGGSNYRHAQGRANARLIASAPELYDLATNLAKFPDEECMISPLVREARRIIALIDGKEAHNA